MSKAVDELLRKARNHADAAYGQVWVAAFEGYLQDNADTLGQAADAAVEFNRRRAVRRHCPACRGRGSIDGDPCATCGDGR